MNTLVLLDREGFELAVDHDVTIKQGKITAARLLHKSSEYTEAYKAEIRNADGVCVWDSFKKEA